MARTAEDLIRLHLGTLLLENAKLHARVEQLTEENQQLKARDGKSNVSDFPSRSAVPS